jgi:hypothetical protein
MKNKTYNNVLKLTKLISEKGYTWEESNQMAIDCFEKAKTSTFSVEHFANMIISKEDWNRETKLYSITDVKS